MTIISATDRARAAFDLIGDLLDRGKAPVEGRRWSGSGGAWLAFGTWADAQGPDIAAPGGAVAEPFLEHGDAK